MLSSESQIARKLARVEQQISLAGLSTSIGRVHTMKDPWRYRVTAGISLGRHVGFRRRGSQSIVGLGDCLISHPLIGRLAASLNVATEAGDLPDFLGKVGLEVRVVESRSPDAHDDRAEDRAPFSLQPAISNLPPGVDSLHCCIVPSPGSPHASIDAVMPLAKFLARFEHMVGVLYRHRQDAPELLFGEPFAMVPVLGRPFYLSAATFFQTNPQLLAALVESLLEAAAATPTDTVVDVYGGVGLFGLLLAPSVRRVVEIEIDPVGLEAAKRSAALHSLANVQFLTGTAEAILPSVGHAETVVVDPPRAGLTPKVLAAIGAMRPKRILYISCQPESMVRDVKDFADQGYAVGDIEVFDFYPQTQHVELFCALTAKSA
jgi:tRNA/tmRNA/rRNA uracil-C5-methylase (TrmA/RlmC/RlmD family)